MEKNFRLILLPFLALALIGLVLSMAAHIAAIAGSPIPFGRAVWGLHIGIFVVWLPTMWVSIRMTRGANRKDAWKIAMAGCPKWMRTAFNILAAYAVLNFILFMVISATHPKPAGDTPPQVIRGFSGHWMIFYGAAFTTLYSAWVIGYSAMDRKCPNGHPVPVTAKFCEQCGAPLEPSLVDRSS